MTNSWEQDKNGGWFRGFPEIGWAVSIYLWDKTPKIINVSD